MKMDSINQCYCFLYIPLLKLKNPEFNCKFMIFTASNFKFTWQDYV